jgi:lipoprotein-anchoring transpeptidase ErfK/SrfK
LRKSGLIAIWLVGTLFVGANLLFGALYAGRVLPGVRVGTLNLGGMDRNQASVALRRQIAEYRVIIQIDGNSYEVKPADLGAAYEIKPTLDMAMSAGRSEVLPLVSIFTRPSLTTLNYAYSLDRTKLQSYVERVVAEQAEAPVDAAVVVTNGALSVQTDKPGLGVQTGTLVSLIQQGITTQTAVIAVQRQPVQADIRATAASQSAQAAQQIVATPLVFTYADKQFVPTPADITGWLAFTKTDTANLAVSVDGAKFKSYIDTISLGIEVAAVNKHVTVVNGVVATETGGQDGLAIDRDSLTGQVISSLEAKQAATIAIPTVKVAYKTIYNRTYEVGDGKYVEINLSAQHLWAYFDHQLVYESAVTSGAAGYGFATVQGMFHIQAKQTNRYLDGRLSPYPYYVHVDYWMPFYGDYGLHDASWRAQFGGQDYYYNGSHGCVNLPLATASWLYGFVDVGTPVWVHK